MLYTVHTVSQRPSIAHQLVCVCCINTTTKRNFYFLSYLQRCSLSNAYTRTQVAIKMDVYLSCDSQVIYLGFYCPQKCIKPFFNCFWCWQFMGIFFYLRFLRLDLTCCVHIIYMNLYIFFSIFSGKKNYTLKSIYVEKRTSTFGQRKL